MASRNDHDGQLNAVLKEFGEQVGLHGLSTSEEGVCTLTIDDELLLNLFANPQTESLVVWMLLGEVPNENREHFLARLLRANLFWHETLGGTLSLLPEPDTVMLARTTPLASLDADGLRATITDFVEFADDYRHWLEEEEENNDPGQMVDEDAIRV